MKLDSKSPTYPYISFLRFTLFQNFPSSAKPTTFLSKEPSFPPLEKLIKEKEQLKPMEFILLSSVPLSGVSKTLVIEVPSTNPLTSLEKTSELAKSMEKMNLQETEISKLKKEIENLQELKSSFQISLSKENQVSDQLKQELQQLRKQTVAGKTLVEVKESV
jgi:DNA gyrase/topoisomerase IV subunit A